MAPFFFFFPFLSFPFPFLPSPSHSSARPCSTSIGLGSPEMAWTAWVAWMAHPVRSFLSSWLVSSSFLYSDTRPTLGPLPFAPLPFRSVLFLCAADALPLRRLCPCTRGSNASNSAGCNLLSCTWLVRGWRCLWPQDGCSALTDSWVGHAQRSRCHLLWVTTTHGQPNPQQRPGKSLQVANALMLVRSPPRSFGTG
jgi:hypothetical protein